MLICSISNSPTVNPVLSLKSHCVFDATALETFVKTNGKDPISNEPMELSDIVQISSTTSSNIPNSTEITSPMYSSIPTMLTSFQSAWDSLSLEIFQLRSELDKTRKELSLALYRQDAAVKVAVGACKERDEARHALAQLINDSGSVEITKSNDEKISENGIVDLELELASESQDWDGFVTSIRNEQESLLLKHKQENKLIKGKSPILSLDVSNLNITLNKKNKINMKKAGKVIGAVKNNTGTQSIISFDTGLFKLLDISNNEGKILTVSKHNIKLNADISIPLLSFWLSNEPYILSYITQKARKGKTNTNIPNIITYQLINLESKESKPLLTELTNISIISAHPTLPILIVANENEFEVFFNDKVIYNQQWNGRLKQIKFHPDGYLIAMSYLDNGNIDIYDLVERNIKLNIATPSSDSCIDFVFANSGYQLMIGYTESIGIFDLRKNDFQGIVELPNAADNSSLMFVDSYSSCVVFDNQYSVYDKKGKYWKEMLSFGGIDNKCLIVDTINQKDAESYQFLVVNGDANICDVCTAVVS